ncbi:DNA methyltransferase [Bacillus cereus]|uniref:DNA methyltransferase n=1 Tax=Bacillus cereus TaxID=1396 RepID=UPI002B250BFA|nr:DNA methyltransferase [Bacillus cereus]MEB2584694.1 DNA methyltransferase [Bacillus cereus]MEB2612173.1 DNA methyltransferase [Bacillus cereus]
MIDVLSNNDVYNDTELRDFIINLEQRYNVTDQKELFAQLVNFSTNISVPVHGWFKYREGYSQQLVTELINRSGITTNEYVIDPFCGSGTTIVEAALNGYSGLGVDVNPMSAFIANTKSMYFSDEDLLVLRQYIQRFELHELPDVEIQEYEDLVQYFTVENFNDLLAIKQFVNEISELKIRDLFKLGLLSIVEEVSDRKRDGNGLAKRPTKISNVHWFFYNKMLTIEQDLLTNRIQQNVVGNCMSGSSENLATFVSQYNSVNGKTAGVIIFSPPYANSFDYFESYKLELRIGDFADSIANLKGYRGQAVRSFISAKDQKPLREDRFIDAIAQEIEDAIPLKEQLTGKKDARTRKVPKMIKGYFHDMRNILQQCGEVLPSGKMCYIVVDQSSYLGKVVPTDLFLGYLAEEFNFVVEEVIICRKAKTSAQQMQRFPYLADILRESIVVLRKQ